MRVSLPLYLTSRGGRRPSPRCVIITATCILGLVLVLLDNLPDAGLDHTPDHIPGQNPGDNPGHTPDGLDDKVRNVTSSLTHKTLGTLPETLKTLETLDETPRTYLEVVADLRDRWLYIPETLARRGGRGRGASGYQTKDVSQHGEAEYVDSLLARRRGGFFVDSGAGDGRTLSSTLFLEQNRDWSGVLIEPDAESFKALREYSGRRAARVEACLSPTGAAQSMSYVGELDGVDVPGEHRLEAYIPWVTPLDDVLNMPHEGYNVSVRCVPLPAVLLALRRIHVDFWALDAGMAEVDVLRTSGLGTIVYDVIAINVWAGSVNETLDKLEQIKEVFRGMPYRPRRLLPKNWKLLEAAMLIVERIPAVYPIKPAFKGDKGTPSPKTSTPTPTNSSTPTNDTKTDSTHEVSPIDVIKQWIHPPKLVANGTVSSLTPPHVSFREGYWDALRALVSGFEPGEEGGKGEGIGGEGDEGTERREVTEGGAEKEGEEGRVRDADKKSKRGFFIETNAREGQLTSTSLYLETRLGWSGVLLEPDPELFSHLLVTRGRGGSSSAVNACLGLLTRGRHQLGERAFSPDYSLTPQSRLGSVTYPPGSKCHPQGPNSTITPSPPPSTPSDTSCVTCIPIATLLMALNQSKVDFLSLHLNDWDDDSAALVDLTPLNVRVISVDFPMALVAGSEGYSRLLETLDGRLIAQGYSRVGRYADGKHLLTTSVFYRRKG